MEAYFSVKYINCLISKKTSKLNIISLFILTGISLYSITFETKLDCSNEKKDPVIINILQNRNVQNAKLQDNQVNPNPTANSSATESFMSSINNLTEKNGFFSKHYKATLFISAIAGSYALSLYTIYYCKNYLEDKSLWSNWQSNLSIEKLMEIPQDIFAQKIFDSINSRYSNLEHFANPTAKFIQDIDKEKNILEKFNSVYKFLKNYYILKIFPINTIAFEGITQKLERLAYIKNIFLSSECISYENKKDTFKKKAF